MNYKNLQVGMVIHDYGATNNDYMIIQKDCDTDDCYTIIGSVHDCLIEGHKMTVYPDWPSTDREEQITVFSDTVSIPDQDYTDTEENLIDLFIREIDGHEAMGPVCYSGYCLKRELMKNDHECMWVDDIIELYEKETETWKKN